MGNKKVMCEICNSEFTPKEIGENHYIARDNVVIGLAAITKTTECKLYDAFDCPICKCQNIIGERKRHSNVIDESLENKKSNEKYETLCDRCEKQNKKCSCDCTREFVEKEESNCFGIAGKESNECAKCDLSYECKKVKHYGCFTKFDAKNYVCKNVCEYSELCNLNTEGEKK